MFNQGLNKQKVSALLLSLMILAGSAYANDIEDSIKEALVFYEEGALKDAVESLNYASQLIRQEKGKQLTELMPEAPDGWTVKNIEAKSVGAAMFGGGITIDGAYTKDKANVSVQLITDSPIMQSMGMLFSNPMMATSDGGKLERIGREKALIKYNKQKQRGEIRMIIADVYLIMINGRNVTEDELKMFAKAFDVKKMKALK